ncbi:MAG TPA: CHAT domain-containing tetratricopeptide repeat protein [Myxococcaceae bacterium]|nr:CHAT domain-containing tetratricopeptide repeat protein [Myxococcaceae bacterium]
MGGRGRQGRGRALARGVLACAVLAGLAASARTLGSGETADDVVRPGEIRTFLVEAAAGTALHLRLEHGHLDLGLRVRGPEGETVGEVENVLRRTDPLTLTAVVEQPGTQRVEIWLRSRPGRGGSIRLTLGPLGAAAPADALRIEAQRLRAEGDQALAAQDATRYVRALEAYERGVALFARAGDEAQRVETLTRKGELLEAMARLPEARTALEEAVRGWAALGDRAREADTQGVLGLVTTELGAPRDAVTLIEQALALRRSVAPFPVSEAVLLNLLAVALGNLGDLSAAVDRYSEALPLARQDGDAELVALVLKNRAMDLEQLGESERAMADLDEARDTFRTLGNTNQQGHCEYALGIILEHLGRAADSWRAFDRALPLFEQTGDARFVAFTFNHLGLLRLRTGKPDQARELFQESLTRLEASGDQRSSVQLRVNLARTLLESGRPAEAIAPLTAGREGLHAVGDRVQEAICLTELARAEMLTGHLLEARRHALEALQLTEELRGSITGPSARAAYAAVVHGRYELLAGVLMALHAREPRAGWDAAALEASESARARALLEVLAAARVDIERDVDPALRAEERTLDQRTGHARHALVEVLGRPHRAEEADAVERQLEALRFEREALQERMRASSARYASLAPARPLSVEEIRTEVLDDSTALVEYLVGERQSFVWVVSRSGLRSATLPGRHAIEQAVAALHRRWSAPHAVDDGGALARALSRMVLGPVADALGARSLVVVADGALQQIPFAALPVPGRSTALIERHTVVSSPSASVLPALGAPRSGPSAGPELAILADPVLARQPGVSPALLRSMEDTGLRALEPLPGARREASAIAARLPADRVVRAIGPDASRATAMGPDVAGASIVHFATHALLDVKRPELSGIVLSDRDASGKPRPGFLSLADVSSMRLSADLVVLSACRTALGKEVRGEGLVGLTRAFMDAGAKRVVGSLWSVPDAPTAALMSRFYALLLGEGRSPAEALRGAQLALRRERRFSAPEAWAGFVLQGDWRPLAPRPEPAPAMSEGRVPNDDELSGGGRAPPR